MKKTTLSIITAGLLLSPAFAAEDLGEVVVTSSSKVPQKIKETTQNVTIVTAEDIEEKGYQSVQEVLSHTAGFAYTTNGGAGQTSSVFIRGLKNENLLVLINGIPLNDYTQPGTAAALEHISIDSIEKIEIIKGGQSSVWGASASAGTINIITKGGDRDNTTISLKIGSHSTTGAGIDISRKFSKGSFALGTHWTETDSISAKVPRSAEKDPYKNYDYYLNGKFNINPNNTVSLFMRRDYGKYDMDDKSANDKLSHGYIKQTLYSVDYHHINGALSIDTKVDYRKIKRDSFSNSNFGKLVYRPLGENTQFSLIANYRFSDKNSLTLDLEHNIYRAVIDNGKKIKKSKLINNVAFLYYTHTVDSLLGADTTFNAVLRYDKYNKFKNKWTYRFGIKRECKLIDGLHSAANIYTGYKAPSIYQFTSAPKGLKPETLKGYDISIGYKKYINITYFNEKIKDKIDSIYHWTTGTADYFNTSDSIKRTGIEVSGEYAFGDSGFVLGANWTHLFRYKTIKGKKAQRVPGNSASLYLDYYFGEASHIGLIANYVGDRRDVDYGTFPFKDVTLKSYTTVDLTYNTTFKNNLKLNVTVKNLFDKKYETVKGYSTEGRSLYATVEYKF